MRQAWQQITVEGQQAASLLGEELPQFLATPLSGLGEGSVSGATRGRIVEAIENLRAMVLAKTLQDVRPQKTRAAWAWRQRDRVACAWLLAMPGQGTSLSNAEFSEAAASNLCLPSPACRGRVASGGADKGESSY